MSVNDQEIYESLRISTIFSGHTFITTGETLSWNDKQDDAYFQAHPSRRFLLRISNSAEFDAPKHPTMAVSIPNCRLVPPISGVLAAVYEAIPPLWALVARLHPKRHAVTAVYRGSAFFGSQEHQGRTIAKTDDDCHVSVVLQAMQMRRGIDGEEWNAFRKQYAQVHATLTTRNNVARVN